MLIDNHSTDKKVYNWIEKYIAEGDFSLVTGYFTIGALVYFSNLANDKIKNYRFVLGDITQRDSGLVKSLDLLNADLSIEKALSLKKIALKAVEFLKLDDVSVKTLEPNFCHAKLYLFNSNDNDPRNHFYITGSSNLTEAGIGLKESHNIELNVADFGGNSQYKELQMWFENLWKNEKAFEEKIVVDEKGIEKKVKFKQYLIDEISKLFQDYLPKDIYYKILFELFSQDIFIDIDNPDFAKKIGRLENSEIYNALYEFQKKGVISLIKRIEKYDGAILADAVGLGKTWSALAVMKYFQNQGRDIVMFCPKKLEQNWLKFRKGQDSRFEKDGLEYAIRYHTDLVESLMSKNEYVKERADFNFTNKKPKLFVIDESHNLRNDKSSRFNYLLEKIIQENEDVKILLLSATPINNSFKDVRNQIKLITAGNDEAYDEKLDIKNLYNLFINTSKHFNEWQSKMGSPISDLVKNLDDSFFRLTDALIVARTRKMIVGQQEGLVFPIKQKPINKYITPKVMENIDTLDELISLFPPSLSGYQPKYYTLTKKEKEIRTKQIIAGTYDRDVLEDDIQRDFFLVKMIYILLLKRLESSWYSFESTAKKILDHHNNALNKVLRYKDSKSKTESDDFSLEDFEDFEDFEDLTLGKREIKIDDIAKSGNLDVFEKALNKDIRKLEKLIFGMNEFSETIKAETEKQNNLSSADTKLQELIKVINEKREAGNNSKNQKILIFTTYTDTAEYLFNQLMARGFTKIAMVSGAGARTDDNLELQKHFEPVLERFAPYTKLFVEKKWENFHSESKSHNKKYKDWKKWVSEIDPKVTAKLNNPIDILIATDTLSEGQNLQDCDMVINYDIHWNPVRTIQRVGRVDRLGSPNNEVFTVNFWPADNINEYLNLQGRIERRMAAMKIIGSEDIKDFTEHYSDIATDPELDNKHTDRMLEQMQNSIDELDAEKSFGFDDLSLETFRQDLAVELNERRQYYENLPNAIFSGVKHTKSKNVDSGKGLIALLGSPPKKPHEKKNYQTMRLVYLNNNGEEILLNDKDILQYLNEVKEQERFGCEKLDVGETAEVNKYSNAIEKWFISQQKEISQDKNGNETVTAGKESISFLNNFMKGKNKEIKEAKKGEKISKKYNKENWDLIAWLTIN